MRFPAIANRVYKLTCMNDFIRRFPSKSFVMVTRTPQIKKIYLDGFRAYVLEPTFIQYVMKTHTLLVPSCAWVQVYSPVAGLFCIAVVLFMAIAQPRKAQCSNTEPESDVETPILVSKSTSTEPDHAFLLALSGKKFPTKKFGKIGKPVSIPPPQFNQKGNANLTLEDESDGGMPNLYYPSDDEECETESEDEELVRLGLIFAKPAKNEKPESHSKAQIFNAPPKTIELSPNDPLMNSIKPNETFVSLWKNRTWITFVPMEKLENKTHWAANYLNKMEELNAAIEIYCAASKMHFMFVGECTNGLPCFFIMTKGSFSDIHNMVLTQAASDSVAYHLDDYHKQNAKRIADMEALNAARRRMAKEARTAVRRRLHPHKPSKNIHTK